MSFSELGLRAELLSAVAARGYHTPTPVQVRSIPVILSGADLLAGAQTGTGKTAAFTLPLLQRLFTAPATGRRRIRALVLTPTRELAAQVGESIRLYGARLPLESTVVFGGVGFEPQKERLRRGVDILVATPGRLLDHAGQRTVDLAAVEILVLDEADRMLDMGFIHDIRRILKLLPGKRQNLLFSATFPDGIRKLADQLLDSPQRIEVTPRNAPAEGVEHLVHPVDRERKRELLSHLIRSGRWSQVLVFTRTKHGANRLARQLEGDGIGAAAIHGNKSQAARTRALADFKRGAIRTLVATDIAARGLDINALPHVVNFELPNVPEDYVHRIGRTGRAGRDGVAVSLVCVDEKHLLRDIEKLLGRDLPREVLAGFEPDASIRAEPIPNGRTSRPVRVQAAAGGRRGIAAAKPAVDHRTEGGRRRAGNRGRTAAGPARARRQREVPAI
jgi:ATP-dependent RNA helicase RhlE